mmetsp:Transcript_26792/g.49232  ORF Transcript_26792/g.49232 Transcript_26792/m.49232 type:complete len:234 (-) Transcript_26792:423-1124(-)
MSFPCRWRQTALTAASEEGAKPIPAKTPPGFTRCSQTSMSEATLGWSNASLITMMSRACAGNALAKVSAGRITARFPAKPKRCSNRSATSSPIAAKLRKPPMYWRLGNSRSSSDGSCSADTPTSTSETLACPPLTMLPTSVRSICSQVVYSSCRMNAGTPRPGTTRERTQECIPKMCVSSLQRRPIWCTSSIALPKMKEVCEASAISRAYLSKSALMFVPARRIGDLSPGPAT